MQFSIFKKGLIDVDTCNKYAYFYAYCPVTFAAAVSSMRAGMLSDGTTNSESLVLSLKLGKYVSI